MALRPGRPHKYVHFLMALDDGAVYCPSSIVAHGEMLGLFDGCQDVKFAKQRVRITLGRMSQNKDFPVGGDGLVILKGQAPIPGWLGSRWKDALG